MPEAIRAAGGVLWRPADGGRRICVVHRPAYDDWSLPKGKLHDGEHPLVAAVREVAEETGVRGRPELRLPGVSYALPDGTPKTVEFWLLRACDGPAGRIADPAEVDRLDWLAPEAAADRLTYPDDRDLVRHVAGLPPVTAVTALVRHGHAGARHNWAGPDGLRPIDPQGQVEAERLVEVLATIEPQRLIAATPLRCRQTLQPLADRVRLPILSDAAFTEPDEPAGIPAKVTAAVARLAEVRAEFRAVICSQGKVIPPLLSALTGPGDPVRFKTPKGGAWLLSWHHDTLLAPAAL